MVLPVRAVPVLIENPAFTLVTLPEKQEMGAVQLAAIQGAPIALKMPATKGAEPIQFGNMSIVTGAFATLVVKVK